MSPIASKMKWNWEVSMPIPSYDPKRQDGGCGLYAQFELDGEKLQYEMRVRESCRHELAKISSHVDIALHDIVLVWLKTRLDEEPDWVPGKNAFDAIECGKIIEIFHKEFNNKVSGLVREIDMDGSMWKVQWLNPDSAGNREYRANREVVGMPFHVGGRVLAAAIEIHDKIGRKRNPAISGPELNSSRTAQLAKFLNQLLATDSLEANGRAADLDENTMQRLLETH